MENSTGHRCFSMQETRLGQTQQLKRQIKLFHNNGYIAKKRFKVTKYLDERQNNSRKK